MSLTYFISDIHLGAKSEDEEKDDLELELGLELTPKELIDQETSSSLAGHKQLAIQVKF